jgi:Ca-activated chloride channel family protein
MILDPASLSFIWPRMLWLLVVLALLAALYGVLLARRSRAARQFATLEIVGMQDMAGTARAHRGGRLRRALPALAWLLALALLILAIARPQAALTLPTRLDTVILAIDASGSMRATDIEPDRITAAQNAAKAFVEARPRHVRVGVVAVAAAAAVVQSPTRERDEIVHAIERLQPQRGTALGSGLIIALDTALPRAGIDVDQFITPSRSGSAPKPAPQQAEAAERDPAQGGSVAIVLLSDGQSNVGPEPLKAAAVAAEYGVRIYTVGMGTTEGAIVKADGWSMRARLDDDVLNKVASTTGGEYFRATDAADLKKIYRALATRLTLEKQRPTEVTAAFAAAGALLALVGATLSMLWFNRIL